MDLVTYAAAKAYTDKAIEQGGGLPQIEQSDYGKVLTATADGWKANALPVYDGTVVDGGE